MAYGAMKATAYTNHNLDNIVIQIEEHLYPPEVETVFPANPLTDDSEFVKNVPR